MESKTQQSFVSISKIKVAVLVNTILTLHTCWLHVVAPRCTDETVIVDTLRPSGVEDSAITSFQFAKSR